MPFIGEYMTFDSSSEDGATLIFWAEGLDGRWHQVGDHYYLPPEETLEAKERG